MFVNPGWEFFSRVIQLIRRTVVAVLEKDSSDGEERFLSSEVDLTSGLVWILDKSSLCKVKKCSTVG
jgi:hypothetical protein